MFLIRGKAWTIFCRQARRSCFPDDEYELVEILRHMPEDEARRIGNAARERILEQHTADHRAMQFEEVVEQCTAIAMPQRAGLS